MDYSSLYRKMFQVPKKVGKKGKKELDKRKGKGPGRFRRKTRVPDPKERPFQGGVV